MAASSPLRAWLTFICILLAGTDVVDGAPCPLKGPREDPCEGHVDVLYDITSPPPPLPPPPPPPPPPPSLPTAEMYNPIIIDDGHGQYIIDDIIDASTDDFGMGDGVRMPSQLPPGEQVYLSGWGHKPTLPSPPPPSAASTALPSLPSAERYNLNTTWQSDALDLDFWYINDAFIETARADLPPGWVHEPPLVAISGWGHDPTLPPPPPPSAASTALPSLP